MHTTILARVTGLLSQLVEVQAISLWQPHRPASLVDYETGFDATDLVVRRQRRSAVCCGGSPLAALTR